MSQAPAPRHRPFVLAGVLALVALLPAAVCAGAWTLLARPQAQTSTSVFDRPLARSTDQPIDAHTLSRLHPVWAYTFAPYGPTRVVVASGVVYLFARNASGNEVAAIQDGKQLWRTQAPDSLGYFSGLLVSGDAVYVATTTDIYAFSARSGVALWRYQVPTRLDVAGTSNSMVYAHAALYFSTRSQVYALDAITGKPRWSYLFSGDIQSAYSPFAPSLAAGPSSLYLFLTTSPYVAGPAVTALDARSGTVRWQIQEQNATTLGPLVTPLVGANGVIYRPLRTGVEALDAATGNTLWTATVGESQRPVPTGMALDTQRLYVAGAGWIQAFDLATGDLVWTDGRLDGTMIRAGPVVSGGVVYVASGTTFTGYGHSIFTTPRAPHWLYAFDAITGKRVRMLQDNDSSFEPYFIAVEGARLYVAGSRDFVAADAAAVGKPELYALGV